MQHQSKKTVCELVGHDWKATPVSNYRVCQRSACRLAQRKQGDTWINVARRTRGASIVQGEQRGLW